MEFNHSAAITSIQHLTAVNTEGLGYDEAIVRETLAVAQADQLAAPKNQEEFQKFIVQKCSDSMQRYTYMRLIDPKHFKNFFVREFDSNLLLVLCTTLNEQVFQNEAFNNATEQEFIVTLLAAIFESP
mmetsp:Transcript_29773/g.39605  ORF Transcript_29773/g.39605 Transcript_29773/m.39605 type:complete len:128 (+) Transcript_29773:254-637(+)|eukprot:CAMPEP_0185579458 /NCGR_PEP_ID=MMETSP0434-20130131/14863_1 /TAXON_ID=626734 ORGANISM="Favella taraikaensis, Strain Fe Narragansett Bay" /NCGR_SAMPLE_ID=MMETSP0434 /ASSEMBLY_ACC=CAM_ASM_000379 /LENGTH=127 /DNA_ID=CAMNT_0028197485 /DNA_START=254 /DNA_END=637 /DNA_ORIENTATION=+